MDTFEEARTGCDITIEHLERSLALKTKQLQDQVLYNSFMLLTGIIVGFLFAKLYSKRTWFKNSK
jgi:hypothetical protein